MEKLLSLIFSNFFVLIIIFSAIGKLLKKASGNTRNTGMGGNNPKPIAKPIKKFNMFDFDLEKWLEEQTGQKRRSPEKSVKRPDPSIQGTQRYSSLDDSRAKSDQVPTPYVTNDVSMNVPESNSILTSNSDEVEKQFELDTSDLQRAVVMAEILGPPRSKRKSFRY